MDQVQDTVLKWTDTLVTIVTTYGLQVMAAIFILIVGWIASRWISAGVARTLSKIKACDSMLVEFFASLVRYAILAFTVIAVLEKFGVATTSFVAILGAAGLAIGLALQGTLTSVAAGVMLLIFRPFRAGDTIEVGALSGTVKGLSLFVTELATADNVKVIVPNSKLWGDTLRNLSANPRRKIDITLNIGYREDVTGALVLLSEVVASDKRVDQSPAPKAVIATLGDAGLKISISGWCAASDVGAVKADLHQQIVSRFTAAGYALSAGG